MPSEPPSPPTHHHQTHTIPSTAPQRSPSCNHSTRAARAADAHDWSQVHIIRVAASGAARSGAAHCRRLQTLFTVERSMDRVQHACQLNLCAHTPESPTRSQAKAPRARARARSRSVARETSFHTMLRAAALSGQPSPKGLRAVRVRPRTSGPAHDALRSACRARRPRANSLALLPGASHAPHLVLDEADVLCVLAEALPADVKAVLADDAVRVVAHAAPVRLGAVVLGVGVPDRGVTHGCCD